MFEHTAHTASQESLNEVVLFGLIGAFLTESTLNATFMRGLSGSDVASLFSLPTMQKEELPEEHQESGLTSLLTIEKRGAMADYADMLANVAYHAGAALQENDHVDLSSLLERENLEDEQSSLELSSRNLTNVIQSLDDRHFVSVKKGRDEEMVELPFLKNARRMICSIFLKRCEHFKSASTVSDNHEFCKLCDMIPAPSVRTVNTLFSLGILARSSDEGAVEMKTDDDKCTDSVSSPSSSTIGNEVAIRCAAVVACWQLSQAIAQQASPDLKVTPIQLSIFLDSVPKLDAGKSSFKSVETFVPKETGQKW
jgi:hypothetical protein